MKELFKMQAAVCKTMASPVRMEIIYALKEGERSVTELVETTGLAKANISQHLAVLKNADMVRSRRERVNIFYSIASPKIVEACRLMREVLMEQLSEKQKLMDRFEKGLKEG
ncbi:MAG: ArsR/SmtB family transcription factor [Thermodesulfobacteriota bacterium]